jgi:hypothetical protein
MRGILQAVGSPPLRRLRWLIATGEALAPELCREWLRRYPSIPMMNAYGPTECSDDVSHAVVAKAADVGPGTVPIGRPIGNTRLYVVDRRLAPVPVGVGGELYVGGDGVGRGYLRDPRKTCRAFVPDPFGDAAGGRLYRTGDLARFSPGGDIDFLGRIDHQVKLRGYRIELGEVENALERHPDVAQAVTMVRGGSPDPAAPSGPGAPRLVAYVVGKAGRPADAAELRSFLETELPDYMVPSAFVELESVPLTPNGKLDRRALPAPGQSDQGREHVAPRNVVEEVLAGIWAGVLGLERVGVRDHFFDLGGHSLLATQIVSLVRRTFQTELDLRVLFETGTVDAMARALEAGETTPGLTRTVAEMVRTVVALDEEAVRQQLETEGVEVQP